MTPWTTRSFSAITSRSDSRLRCSGQRDRNARARGPVQRVVKFTFFRRAGRLLVLFLSARAKRRVFGSADHSEADRTSDRAGAAQEGAAYFQPARLRPAPREVSVKRQGRGRAPPFAPPPSRGPRSARRRNNA